MRPTLSIKHSSVVFLLQEGYTLHQIEDKLVWASLPLVGSRGRLMGIRKTAKGAILPSLLLMISNQLFNKSLQESSDGRVYTWKKKGEPPSDRTTTPTVKHGEGNNLMVWGCMGWNGVRILTEVQGIMNADQYCQILDGGVVESFEKLKMAEGERIFQQDNDSKHASNKATKWLEDNNIQVLVWPAQSPDLNAIEHLWVELKKALQRYSSPPKGVYKLWDRIAEEWKKIPPETCQRLIESMPRRIQAVIKAKGGHTKYQLCRE